MVIFDTLSNPAPTSLKNMANILFYSILIWNGYFSLSFYPGHISSDRCNNKEKFQISFPETGKDHVLFYSYK